MKCFHAVVICILVTSGAPPAQSQAFEHGAKEPQVYFGDPEGNPLAWPQPVFSDGFTPWRQIALGFDARVFTTLPNAHGDAAFVTTPWSDYNELRGVDGFGLDSYFGRNFPAPPNSYQAITAMGALFGGALAGIDYSDLHRPNLPRNLVRLVKKWFASDLGADVFLNNVRTRGGADWWYDIFPNILACQLSDLFHNKADAVGDPKLADLCGTAIERWYEAVDYLRDGGQLPEFAYKAVQLVDGPVSGSKDLTAQRFQPIGACDTGKPGYKALNISRHRDPQQVCFGFPHYNGDTFESDSAGALAYLGLLGFEETGKPDDRQLADWGETFLDRTSYNPLYENFLPYGAYVSARMNAELGTRHDTDKLLGEVFSTSTVRPGWGMIGKNWGDAPAYGLVGSRKTGREIAKPVGPDYAFAMDTMQFAATLAPIPRYDPSTAAAIGKYLSHVAHNARFFYPAFLTFMDPTTAAYIASSGTPDIKLALPFEGLKSKFPGQVDHEPYGTGDALKSNRDGAYRTDLGVYSGIYAGAMAKIFNSTAVDDIYQIDLLATDIPAPKAYPSYLFYNPYDEPKLVSFRDDLARKADSRLKTGKYLLYDTVNKDIVARHVTTGATITIPPHEAVVIVTVPESDSLEIVGNRMEAKNTGTVVDFDWRPK
jgi:hypothetical protein